MVILDLQVGLYGLARDWDPTLYRDNMMAHAQIGNLFNIPTIMTTSAQQGPNGPLPKEILEAYPNATLIKRQGEVNAWDNEEFRNAVKASGKKQIILAGITTDVCKFHSVIVFSGCVMWSILTCSGTAFLALSLRSEGYSVWANIEASGTTTPLIRDASNDRMQNAGVQLVSTFAIVCDLMRDWRNTPGAAQLIPWLDKYYPAYGFVARGHLAAIENGTVQPGEAGLV